MKEIPIISRTTPAKPRSANYPISSSPSGGGGTVSVSPGGGVGIDIIKTGDSTAFSDTNVLSSLRANDEFINRKKDSSVTAIVDYLKGLKINGMPVTRILNKDTEEGEFSDTDIMSALRVIAEIAAHDEELKKLFLSKTTNDRTPFKLEVGDKLTAEKGIQISKNFVSGIIGGSGGYIYLDENGKVVIETDKAVYREEIITPKITFNCIDVISGDKANTFAYGTIKTVDAENRIATLDLLEGQYGTLHVSDICRGVFHNIGGGNTDKDTIGANGFIEYSGFATSYFTPTNILENEAGIMKFEYELQVGTSVHPMPGMNFFGYGNFTDEDRQAITYENRYYTRRLAHVNTWVIDPEVNVMMQTGDLSGLSIGGMDFSGYSFYGKNVYISGTIERLKPNGTPAKDLSYEGVWESGRKYDYYDSVTHDGSTWACMNKNGSSAEPGTNNDWQKIASKGDPGESAVFADLTNEMDNVALTNDGKVYQDTSISTVVWMSYGSKKMTLTGITCTLPANVTETHDVSTGEITFSVKQGVALDGRNPIPVALTATYNGKAYTGQLTFTMAGVKGGADAVLYRLVPSVSAVIKDANGNLNVTSVSCTRLKSSVSGGTAETGTGELKYSLDGGAEVSIGNNAGVPVSSFQKSIKFIFYVDGKEVDVETIPLVTDGKDGSDGTDYERVFIHTTEENRPSTPATSQTDDYIPSGWHDDPIGVSESLPFEWISERKKRNGIWSNFSTPALWAKYGFDGIDGAEGVAGTSIVWKGDFSSAPSSPQNGWAYKNTTDKKSYVYQDGQWYQMTIDGIDGKNGKDGLSIVWKGDLQSPPSNPQINWAYRDTNNGRVYIWNGTAWSLMVVDGSDGADGAAGSNGLSVFITYNDSTSQPSVPTGNGTTGGWHTNATSGAIWMSQKVASSASDGTWGTPIKIKGDKGESITAMGRWYTGLIVPKLGIVTMGGSTFCAKKETANPPLWTTTTNDGRRITQTQDGGRTYGYILSGESNTEEYDLLVQSGKDGLSIVWKGDLQSPPSNPQINWAYRDTNNGRVYIWNGTAWSLMVVDGSDGADGAAGSNGLSVFITYNDSTSQPSVPTGNGTTGGWHTNATSGAIWMSQKVASSASDGTWGTPIKIKGDKGESITAMGRWYTGLIVPKLGVVTMGGSSYIAKKETTNPPLWTVTKSSGQRIKQTQDGGKTYGYILSGEMNSAEYDLLASKGEDGIPGATGKPGADGKPGEKGEQGIQGCIIRHSEWAVGVVYRNDEALTSGTRYVDIAMIRNNAAIDGWDVYKCNTTHTSSESNKPGVSSSTWTKLSGVGPIYTSLIIAKNGSIDFFQGNQFLIKKDDGTVTAGMSGSIAGSKVRIWAGAHEPDDAPFRVLESGRMIATDVDLTGTINAISGTFRNVSSPNGSFKIKENGDVELVGKISTSLNGTRIELDPSSNSIKMYNQDNKEVGNISFITESIGGVTNYYPRLMLRRYSGNKEVGRLDISGTSVNGYSTVGTDSLSFTLGPFGLVFAVNGQVTNSYPSK